MAVAGPVLYMIAADLAPGSEWWLPLPAAALLSAAGLIFAVAPRTGRVLAIIGLLATLPSTASAALASPVAVLLGLVALVIFWRALYEGLGLPAYSSWLAAASSASATRGAGVSVVGVCSYAMASGPAPAELTEPFMASAVASLCIAHVYVLAWVLGGARVDRVRRRVVGAAVVAGATVAVLYGHDARWIIAAVSLAPVLAALASRFRPDPDGSASAPFRTPLVDSPARLVVVTFLVFSIVGTLALAVPASSPGPGSIPLIDAAFTAVSAVCVTGLNVLDTPNAFTGLGQAMILALVQLGGLGIMSFYTVTLGLLGQRLSLRHELAVAQAAGVEQRSLLSSSLRQMLTVTFASEALGAALLFARFAILEPPGTALWRAVFTAVSAFCNAGFALQSDSLVRFQRDPFVLHVVALLIILGGLSPYVVASLPALARRQVRATLEIRLVLVTNATLLLAGAALFLAFEWSASLHGLTGWDRVHNAWFQSVTARTAGFNSVDTASVSAAAQLLIMVLMFIGGSPGGTAGGIKTTTLAVLALAVVAALRGRSEVVVYGRRIGHASVYKAAAVATVGATLALVALTAVLLTQRIPPLIAGFEVVSALGTVGLSTGGTLLLDEVGKLVIMACMFMGRVGPLTLFLLLVERQQQLLWTFPEEEVHTG